MTKLMRKNLAGMTVKELKTHISRTNIKRYSHLRKTGLIELMVANKERFGRLNKKIPTRVGGKILAPPQKQGAPRKGKVKKAVRKIERKQQDFQRPTPTPSKSVAAQKPTGLMLI